VECPKFGVTVICQRIWRWGVIRTGAIKRFNAQWRLLHVLCPTKSSSCSKWWMDSVLTCILVLVTSMFKQAVVYLHRHVNTQLSDNRFYELIRSNVSVYKLYTLSLFTVRFANFNGSPEEMKCAQCGPSHPSLWHACCRQTNFMHNMHMTIH